MKLHLSLPHPMNAEATSARRWWLGWAQLILVWVLCMLLCANVALALVESFGTDEPPPPETTATRFMPAQPADCAVFKGEAGAVEPPAQTLRQSLRCSGVN